MASKNILITGGSGLIGERLTELLLEKGYHVAHLSRTENLTGPIKKYRWDPATGFLDQKSLENVAHIIHLAGAGVADKRWTADRKKEILASRVQASQLLFKELSPKKNSVVSIVSASAIGYYGFSAETKIFTEKDKAGTDFLAQVTEAWEKETNRFNELGVRNTTLRIGVVLSEKGGALPQMVKPIRYFAGAALGSGQQIISWISLDDLCKLFIYCIENESVKGVFNAVSNQPVSNSVFTKMIGKVINRPVWPIAVPEFILNIALGEMAQIVTKGSHISNRKLLAETDFEFKDTDLKACLTKLLKA